MGEGEDRRAEWERREREGRVSAALAKAWSGVFHGPGSGTHPAVSPGLDRDGNYRDLIQQKRRGAHSALRHAFDRPPDLLETNASDCDYRRKPISRIGSSMRKASRLSTGTLILRPAVTTACAAVSPATHFGASRSSPMPPAPGFSDAVATG